MIKNHINIILLKRFTNYLYLKSITNSGYYNDKMFVIKKYDNTNSQPKMNANLYSVYTDMKGLTEFTWQDRRALGSNWLGFQECISRIVRKNQMGVPSSVTSLMAVVMTGAGIGLCFL